MKGMQAKLPDVNGAIVRHRNGAMIAFDQKHYSKAAIELNALNSLLPDGYRVTINSDRYYSAVSSRHTIQCRYCTKTIIEKDDDENEHKKVIPSTFEITTIMIYPMILSSIDSLISGRASMPMWDCPNCFQGQPIEGSIQKHVKYEKPYFLGCIPDFPTRKGLHDRVGYTDRFNQWYEIALQEIEKKVADYRRDYRAQNPDEDLSKYEEFLKQDDET